jgi:DNA-binding transcriptional ArsR family regulator
MQRTWIKLYLNIIDEVQMARLPNALWRRAIELSIMAGRHGDDGTLPSVDNLAWRLRTTPRKLLEQLQALEQAGLVHRDLDGNWVVSKFACLQAPLSEAERSARYRARKRDTGVTNEAAEAAAAVTSDSTSTSASDSQGERVQGEGESSPGRASRKRHKAAGPSSAQAEYALNAGSREAERLLLRVARLAALPPGEVPRIEQVAALAARYGLEQAERELTAQHERWIATVSEKTGKTYSPLNFGWVDWADAVLAGLPQPGPQPVELEPLYDGSEYDEMVLKAAPPPPETAETLARMEARVAQRAGQP